MDKIYADKIITSFLEKIYRFSLSKTKNIDLAEELASRITFEVYKSLLKVDEVFGINNYIYRIANNVYAQFVKEEIENKQISQHYQNQTDNEPPKDKIYEHLRNEILYLSNLQRDIVVMHYYQKIKTKDIANRLNISQAKVKWHLIEARTQLKDGVLEIKKIKYRNQISFTEMRSIGKLGFLQRFIDMSFYFKKNLSQNIAYTAYKTPKTTVEIAKEIATPVAFVEDEINHLLESGFMTKLPGKKYLTNIYIVDSKIENREKVNELLTHYAKIIGDKYVPLLFQETVDKFFAPNNKKAASYSPRIYIPEKNLNFLMWSIVAYSCVTKLVIPDNKSDISKYMVKRKDGGENIAHAIVGDDFSSQKNFAKNHIDLWVSSNTKNTYPISVWQFFSHYDDRQGDFTQWTQKIFFTLYDFISGRINKDLANLDKYISLFDKGFIVSKKNTDIVNMIVTNYTESEFQSLLPTIPDELKEIGIELNSLMYKMQKKYFPKQMQDLCRIMNQNSFRKGDFRVFVFKYLLEKGLLKPLKKHQRKTVNMILFSDILPK